MLRILLDPQIFNLQTFGGISRYHIEVFDILKSKDNIQIECPVLYTENKHFTNSYFFSKSYQQQNSFLIKYSKIFKPYRPQRLISRTEQHTKSQINKQQFDVFIPTYYNPYFLPELKDKPFVLTVHDMIHELFPHYFSEDSTTSKNKKVLIENATRIIAVSENTKADILKIYPHIPATKIRVINLATTLFEQPDVRLNLPDDYILFVGNRSLYKNFDFFIRSAAKILNQRPTLSILCAGGPAFDDKEEQMFMDLGIKSQIMHREFEDSELAAYYKQASCFVFPSEYEGFGIPILEAMVCGCPVVLAKHSSFPEVAGDAGVYFTLNDAADLVLKIKRLLDDRKFREECAYKGRVQAQNFSWEKTAVQSLEVYKEAAAEYVIT